MRRGSIVALALGLLAVAGPARALQLSDVRGHMTLGFSHLFVSDTSSTPGGSLSFGAGVAIPLSSRLGAGVDFGYHALGSRTLVQGSLSSGIDYSLLEAMALIHWSPLSSGPDLILSAGPGLFRARAQLAASSIGLAFTAEEVDDVRVGAAFNVTVVRRKPTPVRPGIDLGLKFVPLEKTNWTVFSIGIGLVY